MTKGKYANVNGLEMYYEIQGKGQPLVLLHGGLGLIGMFEQLLPTLAEGRQVIGVELQGHGHTPDIDRPFSCEQMADDVAVLVEHLGRDKVDFMGYSLGGCVALQIAIRHPEVVRKLVLVSTPFNSDAWYPEVRAGMKGMNADAANMMVGSPPHQAYVNASAKPDAWTTLVTKTGQLISQDYDWSKGVASIQSPTMIVVGDADSIRPEHTVEFFQLLGGGKRDAGWDGSQMPHSRLAVLPGTTHYNVIFSPLLAPMVTPFLDE
ncbi:MAG: alpha/beta fold hydrolase [Chloroflexi bacterium]|nr:alpha/beta fold hydrolase [Chloroflexota bacterium]